MTETDMETEIMDAIKEGRTQDLKDKYHPAEVFMVLMDRAKRKKEAEE